jgi:hypothetical protein
MVDANSSVAELRDQIQCPLDKLQHNASDMTRRSSGYVLIERRLYKDTQSEAANDYTKYVRY